MDNTIAVIPFKFQENITLRTVGGNMALKFSTGAKDSLHPELVRAGFTPEDATATLAGEPPLGFECDARGIAYPTVEQLRREGSLNPEAEQKYMLLQTKKSIDGGRSFGKGDKS